MTLSLPLSIQVYFKINGVNVDVSSYILGIGGRNAIRVEWGIGDRSTVASPTKATFQLRDPNGDLNPKNAYSPYFGQFGTGVPVTIVVNGGTRYVLELASMKPRSGRAAGADTVVDVVLASRKRRDATAVSTAKSVAYRTLTLPAAVAETIAYWPMEEESEATATVALTADTPNFAPGGTEPRRGGYTGHPAAARMLTMSSDGFLFAPMPSYTSTGTTKIMALWHFPAAGLTGTPHVYRMWFEGGTALFFDLILSGETFQLVGYNMVAVATGGVTATTGHVNGKDVALAVTFEQVGADAYGHIDLYTAAGDGSNTSIGNSSFFAGFTLGRFSHMTIGMDPLPDASVGHVIVGNSFFAFSEFTDGGYYPWRGYTGEPCLARMYRLASEGDIALLGSPNDYLTLLNDSRTMGPQRDRTLDDLIEECAAVDGGLLGESRASPGQVGRFYRAAQDLYSQPAKVSVNYSQLGSGANDVFAAADDDTGLVTAVTVERAGGGASYRSVSTSPGDGYHKTEADPADDPQGVGLRESGSIEQVLELDQQVQVSADWLLHQATWDEPRYPSIKIDLTRQINASDATLVAAVPDVYLGDVIEIDTSATGNRWLDPVQIRALVLGGVEEIAQYNWTFTFNSLPANAWEADVIEMGGSALVAPATTTGNTWRVETTRGPQWEESAVPYYIQASGEVVRVTAASTPGAAYIGAGTASTANNASVTPTFPAGLTADVGQALILVTSMRPGSAGGANAPSGWELIAGAGTPLRVFGRYYRSGDAAPTVTVSGGAAGDDVFGQIFAFSGVSLRHGGSSKTAPAEAGQSNASATNVAYPALPVFRDDCLVLYIGARADDATSVAALAGATEISDTAATAGNDMHVMIDYAIQTVATDISAGSFTVTTAGGAAVSRAMVLALRPLQSLTVTRSVNGIVATKSVGSAVKTWRPGVVGL